MNFYFRLLHFYLDLKCSYVSPQHVSTQEGAVSTGHNLLVILFIINRLAYLKKNLDYQLLTNQLRKRPWRLLGQPRHSYGFIVKIKYDRAEVSHCCKQPCGTCILYCTIYLSIASYIQIYSLESTLETPPAT